LRTTPFATGYGELLLRALKVGNRDIEPLNKGRTYPADPPTVEELIAIMRCAGDTLYGLRTRTLIVLLWRAGLRISEALALAESDLHPATGGVLRSCWRQATLACTSTTASSSASAPRNARPGRRGAVSTPAAAATSTCRPSR
jgi:hypothetical protein